jgi:hypothetical protein
MQDKIKNLSPFEDLDTQINEKDLKKNMLIKTRQSSSTTTSNVPTKTGKSLKSDTIFTIEKKKSFCIGNGKHKHSKK